jgi:hypothetical protein
MIRIIHWDYVDLGSGVFSADSDIQMLSGALKDVDTNEKSGLYIRWALRIYVSKELILSCIAESDHRVNVYELSAEDFIKITKDSLNEFRKQLRPKIEQTNITVSFEVDLTYQEASRLLLQLCEQ